MQKTKLTLAAAAFVATLPFLQGCVPAVIVGGVAAGVGAAVATRSPPAEPFLPTDPIFTPMF